MALLIWLTNKGEGSSFQTPLSTGAYKQRGQFTLLHKFGTQYNCICVQRLPMSLGADKGPYQMESQSV